MPSDRMAQMDEAGRQAHVELDKMLTLLTPGERQTVQTIFDWLKRHYRTAGYKRLCRPLVSNSKQ